MSAFSGPEIPNSGLIWAFDANNIKSFTNLATGWTDYYSNQANYQVLSDNNSVMLKNTSAGWIGYFPSTAPATGRYYITFTYYSTSGTPSLILDNDGVMDNTFNATIPTSITPQVYSAYIDYNTTGANQFFFRQNATGSGDIIIKNFRHFSVSSMLDISGNGKTMAGSALTYATDGSLVFNGSSAYGNITAPLSGTSSTPFTMMAWAKTNTASGWQTVIGTAGTYRQIGFGGTAFYYGGNAGGGNFLISGGSIVANTWYHLALTYNGTTAYGYLNSTQTTGNIGSNGGTISNNYLGTYSPSGELLNGSIAHAAIYNTALTAEQIKQIFNATRGRFGI